MVPFQERAREWFRRIFGPQFQYGTTFTVTLPRAGKVEVHWSVFRNKSIIGRLSDEYPAIDSIEEPRREFIDISESLDAEEQDIVRRLLWCRFYNYQLRCLHAKMGWVRSELERERRYVPYEFLPEADRPG